MLDKDLKIVLGVKAQGIALEAANPRHAHEWAVWKDIALPDDKILLPGVIDTRPTMSSIRRWSPSASSDSPISSGASASSPNTDCGFGTAAGYGKLDPEIAFLKLARAGRRRRARQ